MGLTLMHSDVPRRRVLTILKDVLEEMHRCRCGTQVPFYSIAECSCSTRWKYSIRCHIEGCITEHCTTHGTCWSRHLPRASDTAWADNDDDHLPVDPKGQLFARTVIFSETNGESLSRMHAEDKLSRWFHIQQHGSQPKLCVYDRFSQITDPSRSGNVASAKQYPGFVSFIGKSGVGKSTLVRAMVLLGALNESGLLENQDDWMYNRFHTLNAFASILSEGREVPVTKSGNLNDLIDPTTFGVHLYKDGQEAPASEELERTQCPILFADCEGFYAGNALPNSELYDENAPESAYALQRHLLYEEDIVSPSYNTHDKRGAELFYARYLYAISDTIVFVSDDDNLMEHSITSIFEWAAAAVHNSVNHPSRKTLIIVRHKGADHRPELYDDNVLRRAYLNQRRKIWTGSKILDKFVTDYNSKQDMSACIYDNTDLYKVLFSDISCCYIPNKNNVNCKPDDLFRQYRSLRDKIDGASQRAQSLRQKGWAQYNSATLSSILLKAFEHFRQSEEPFDFYRAARNDNPTPRGFADHIANFLRLAFQSLSDKEETLKMTQQSIALSFITWAMRNFDHCKSSRKNFRVLTRIDGVRG